MKKFLCALLILCMITSLFTPAFAVNENTGSTTPPDTQTPEQGEGSGEEEAPSEFHITKIAVTGLTTPVAGAAVSKTPLEKAKVTVTNEEKEELSFTASAAWKTSEEKFAAGKTYRIDFTLEFDFMNETKLILSNTEVSINDKAKETLSNKTVTNGKITFYTEFESALGEGGITPKVELDYGSAKTKTYDGKALEVKAKITNQIDGVEYRYEWYRDGKLLEDESSESLALVNCADSGKYSCKVYAKLDTEEKSTATEAVEITINRCVVTVEIKDADKFVNEDDPDFEYEIVGDQPYDQLSGEPVREEGEKLGKYAINQGTLAFPENVADNYELKVNPGTLEILPEGSNKKLKVMINDSSRITGKNDAKIRVDVIGPEGVFSEDDIVILDLPEDATVLALESKYKKDKMKGFSVKILSADNKNIILPEDTLIRFQIPLTKEEESYKKDSVLCVLRTADNATRELKITLEKNGEITYAVVEIDTLGTLLLFKGEKEAKPTAGIVQSTEKKDEEKKGGAAWLWILISILTLCAIGAIVYTVLQARNTPAATKRYTPAKKPATPLTPEQIAARERARRIADEINAMPPVPEAKAPAKQAPRQTPPQKKIPAEEGMKTRAVPTVKPNPAPGPVEPKTRKISFDDLEG